MNVGKIRQLAEALNAMSKDVFLPAFGDKESAIRHGFCRTTEWVREISVVNSLILLRKFIEQQEAALEMAKAVLTEFEEEN